MTRRTLLPAAMLALLAGTAAAQFVPESSPAQPASGNASGHVTTIVQVENGRRAELRLEGGRVVTARIDGQDWPIERIRSSDDHVVLLDADGNTVQRFMVRVAPPVTDRIVVTRPLPPAAPLPPAQGAIRPAQAPPAVMLGITFSEPGEALRAHLNLGDQPALLVDGVIESLPAAKAGLRRHDIITSINGSEGASSQTLRDAMVNAKPDDILRLTIRRGAETVQTEVRLAAFDAAAMNVQPALPDSARRDPVDTRDLDDRLEQLIARYATDPENQEILEELQSLTTERAKRIARDLSDQARQLAGEVSVEGLAELERLQSDLEQKADEAMRYARRQMLELRDGRLFIRSGEFPARSIEEFREEVNRRAPQLEARFEERMRAMESRMEAVERSMEARMDRLAALMERMAERLERDGERKD